MQEQLTREQGPASPSYVNARALQYPPLTFVLEKQILNFLSLGSSVLPTSTLLPLGRTGAIPHFIKIASRKHVRAYRLS